MPEAIEHVIKRQELAAAEPATPGLMPASRITSEDRSRMRALGELLASAYHSGQFRRLPWPDNLNKETPEIRRAYREMLRDGSIRSAFYSKIWSVASLDVQVVPADESPAAQRVAEFVRWNIVHGCLGGYPKIARSILEGGCSEGVSLGEPVIDIERRGKYRLMYTLQKFKAKDSKLYDLEIDNFNEVKSVYVKATNRRIDPKRFVIWSYLSMFESIIGSSDFRACYREFLIIDVAMRMAAIDVERFVLPMLVGNYSQSDQKELMEEALRTARSLGFAALPEGASIQALQLATAGPDRIDARIKMCQANVFMCIAGASLQAMEGQKTGSLAMGRVHQNQAQLPIWFLASEVSEVMNNQLVPVLVDLNFGEECPLPTVVVSGVDDAATKEFADLIERAQRIGLKPSRKDVAKRLGIQEAQTPDDELVAQPGGAGGMPGNQPEQSGLGALGIFSQKPRNKPRPRCVRYSTIAVCGDDNSNDEEEDETAGGPQKKKYSSTQFNLPDSLAKQVIALGLQIRDEDLAEKGRELEPHVTVKYGLHDNDPFRLRQIIDGVGRVRATIGGVSLFENDDEDVIKLDVNSPDLRRLNSKISNCLECTDTHSDYRPHITIAYTKPGRGKKYASLISPLKGQQVTFDEMTFSNKHKEKSRISLRSGRVRAFSSTHSTDDFNSNLAAASGQDERRIVQLLRTARDQGVELILSLARKGLKQGLHTRDGTNFIWTPEQRGQLADFFFSMLTTGEMLGRARIRLRADQWRKRGRVIGFAEPTDFSAINNSRWGFTPGRLLPAEEAIRFFLDLVPSLNTTPDKILPSLERAAFTLAASTQFEITKQVQKVIGESLISGKASIPTSLEISDILNAVGISPKNPQYAEMVVRTNSMDAWNVGQDRERQTPEMMVAFPVWQYVGIADGRERSEHAVHFDKYFPAAMSFVQVRDSVKVSPWNCRCSQIPVDKSSWENLLEHGYRISTT